MGTNFENNLVNSINSFFEENGVNGVAWRHKQARFTDQKLDIFVDTADNGYIGIEHKSVKTSSSNKLYFSQHFSSKDGKHQIETISEFLESSGRTGFLVILLKRGRGKGRQTFIMEWELVQEMYEDDECAGIDLRLLEDMASDSDRVTKLPRVNAEWQVEEVFEELVR